MSLAKRLNQALADKGWSQEKLASVCNALTPNSITQQAVHMLVSGKTLGTTKGPVLARALGVNLIWLLTGQGHKYASTSMIPEDIEPLVLRMIEAREKGSLTAEGVDLIERVLDQITRASPKG